MARPKPDPSATLSADGHGTSVAIDARISQESAIDATLRELAGLPVDALRKSWARRFGQPPPKSISRRLLEYAAAYEVQARIHGGLKPAVRRKLLQIALKRVDGAKLTSSAPPRHVLSPGTRLLREWRGRSHTVEVTDHGFLYAGRQYRSLSEIARAITGARWSGPRFFGL
jgi:Protein of unknown function (DUF2924)